VLFAGSASPNTHSGSLVVLQMAEITLIDALTSEQVLIEAEQNLRAKLPDALAKFRLLVKHCLRIVPAPTYAELSPYIGLADPKDLPILVATIQTKCSWLVTFNVRHYHPGHPTVKVVTPGEFILQIRNLLSHLA